ncbi:MAG: hypothetical protein IJY21_03140, partial [Clostridia bacterium]|nr:hypothetical protein [Clostridia bacterium]
KKVSPRLARLAKNSYATALTSKLAPAAAQPFFLPCKQGGKLFRPFPIWDLSPYRLERNCG